MLWEVDIYPASGQPDRNASVVAAAAADLGIAPGMRVVAGGGYLIQGDLDRDGVSGRAVLIEDVASSNDR